MNVGAAPPIERLSVLRIGYAFWMIDACFRQA